MIDYEKYDIEAHFKYYIGKETKYGRIIDARDISSARTGLQWQFDVDAGGIITVSIHPGNLYQYAPQKVWKGAICSIKSIIELEIRRLAGRRAVKEHGANPAAVARAAFGK